MKNQEVEDFVRKYDLYQGRGLQYDLMRRIIVDPEDKSVCHRATATYEGPILGSTFLDVGYFYCPYIPKEFLY